MFTVGQCERLTQQRVLHYFQNELAYRYLSYWKDRDGIRNVEEELLCDWLAWHGHEKHVIDRALRELNETTAMSRYALSQPWASIFTGPVVEGADG